MKFEAPTMAEALRKVKRALGRDALIVNTRVVRQGGLLGIGSQSRVEITAMPDRGHADSCASKDSRTSHDTLVRETLVRDSHLAPSSFVRDFSNIHATLQELIRETRAARNPDIPLELLGHYQRLIQADVAEDIAQQLVHEVRGTLTAAQLTESQAIRTVFADVLARRIPLAGPIRLSEATGPSLVVLVGPTGVGKTTTVAKLAANLSILENRRVGIITIDTQRIGAVQQWKEYAPILEVPLQMAASPQQFVQSVEHLHDREIILVDTAGLNPNDSSQIRHLAGFFTAIRPDEIHLVLSGTTGRALMEESVRKLRVLGVDRLIFSKLDEASACGGLLSCLDHTRTPLSYVTTGPNVPRDLEVGQSSVLADRILGLPLERHAA